MITLVRAGAEDLETIIAIQRASFKAVYENTMMNMTLISRTVNESNGNWAERPNSYYYFVKKDEENIGFLRVQTNEELTEAWLGDRSDFASVSGKRVWF